MTRRSAHDGPRYDTRGGWVVDGLYVQRCGLRAPAGPWCHGISARHERGGKAHAFFDLAGTRAGAGSAVFVLQHPCASDKFLAADVRLAVCRGAGVAAGVAGAAARCTGPARAGAAMRGGCAAGGFAGQCRRPAAVLWPDRWLVGLAASRATGRGHGTAKAAQPAGLIAELGFVGVVVGGGAVHPRPG